MEAVGAGIGAIGSLHSLYEIVRDVRNSNDPEKLRNAAAQILDLALAAREQTSLLQEQRNAAVVELAALKAKIESANRFDNEAKNYARVRTHSGATVYREQGAAGVQDDSPYYCPTCFANKRLSIMNPGPKENTSGHTFAYVCGGCNTSTQLPRLGPAAARSAAKIADGTNFDVFD